MGNNEDMKILPMPYPKPLEEMTEEELSKFLTMNFNHSMLIKALIEANTRKDCAIADLTKRVAFLENKALKKTGRPRTCFYLNGIELTDEELMYQIDSQFFSIRKLEKEVGAGKNQLRNRYHKAKKKQKLIKEATENGDC